MNANELRIGDLVNVSGFISEIDTISSVACWVTFLDYQEDIPQTQEVNTEKLEPIPITIECLRRFGFDVRRGDVCDFWHIGINPLTNDWLFYIKWLYGREYPFYKNGYHKIIYVHQLQNLYYALTGKELEFK